MENIVFIIGCGRSGTTWLHLMLGSHEQIATGQESQLFHNYIRPMRDRWLMEINYPKDSNLRFHGISSYIKEEQFYGLLRNFADGVFCNVMKEKPGATHFLEKSPNNSFNVDIIARCYPKARFIHVIRDGRDVAASMLAAGKGWGRYWAPSRVEPAALEWKTAIHDSRTASELSPYYMEVRYEDLLDKGYQELERIFQFLDIPCSQEQVQSIYDAHTFDKLQSNNYQKNTFLSPGETVASGTEERQEPKGFFRKGKAGDWQTFFNKSQQDEFYYIAGDLLEELGYLEPGVHNFSKPLGLTIRHMSEKFKGDLRALAKKVV